MTVADTVKSSMTQEEQLPTLEDGFYFPQLLYLDNFKINSQSVDSHAQGGYSTIDYK